MRILHFCTNFSPLTETFIYDYVTELERLGTDNHVVCLRRENEDSRPFDKVAVVEAAGRWNPVKLGFRALASVGIGSTTESSWSIERPRLASVVRRVEPDVIHAHYGPEAVMIAPVARRMGVPLVATFYGYDISRLALEAEWQRRYRRFWPGVSAVTVLSKDMRRRAIHLGCLSHLIHVVHLSRDLDLLPFRQPTRRVERFISVGRLTEKKGHLDAIDAVGRAIARGIDASLDIVGSGLMRPAIEHRIRDHQLDARIRLHGSIGNSDVLQLMREADALLLCSKTAADGDQEGTPTVIVEAQALGLPCVATAHAGIPEMIPEGHHRFLAPEGDVASLADRIVSLCACSVEELERIAVEGRAMVEREFNLTTECGKLIELYEMSNSNPPLSLQAT
jgi:colanic acid/amylovoran biosynthesis glycosyltransferase